MFASIRYLALAVVLLLSPTLGRACDLPVQFRPEAISEPMRFFMATTKGNMSTSAWIAAVGEIRPETPEEFRRFLVANGIPSGHVVLHSLGGSLEAGLALGREIRAREMTTHIGRTEREFFEPERDCGSNAENVSDGVCYSACAYAFLGGVARFVDSPYYVTPGSRIGFHQFWRDPVEAGALTPEELTLLEQTALSTTQVITGGIVLYLIEMGVNAELIALITSAGRDDLYEPDAAARRVFQIETGIGLGPWFMEPYADGLVAASRGENADALFRQVTAFCTARNDRQPSLLATMDFRSEGWEARDLPVAALEITTDQAFIHVDRDRLDLRLSDGQLFITARLLGNEAEQIRAARGLRLRLDGPRAIGGFNVEGGLDETEGRMIALAWRNCI